MADQCFLPSMPQAWVVVVMQEPSRRERTTAIAVPSVAVLAQDRLAPAAFARLDQLTFRRGPAGVSVGGLVGPLCDMSIGGHAAPLGTGLLQASGLPTFPLHARATL